MSQYYISRHTEGFFTTQQYKPQSCSVSLCTYMRFSPVLSSHWHMSVCLRKQDNKSVEAETNIMKHMAATQPMFANVQQFYIRLHVTHF